MKWIVAWAAVSVSVYVALFLLARHPKLTEAYVKKCPKVFHLLFLVVAMETAIFGSLPVIGLIAGCVGWVLARVFGYEFRW